MAKTNILLVVCKNSSTYWEGKADMETLQRIYGISFPDPKMLKEWEKFQEEAKNRDHRKLGRVRTETQGGAMGQQWFASTNMSWVKCVSDIWYFYLFQKQVRLRCQPEMCCPRV